MTKKIELDNDLSFTKLSIGWKINNLLAVDKHYKKYFLNVQIIQSHKCVSRNFAPFVSPLPLSETLL